MGSRFDDVIPIFGPDDRQGFFYRAVSNIRDQMEDDVSIIPTSTGFPAAYVDLGWLQETISNLCASGRIETLDDVREFVYSAIQRCKSVKADEVDGVMGLRYFRITAVTKDDKGYYDYTFQARRSIYGEESGE